VVAIGGLSYGVLAIGAGAFGVVAIGQGAFGVLVIGQLSIGAVSLGQLALGVYWAAGMVGAAGRGWGLVIPLVPWLGPASQPPQTTTLDAVGAGEAGWVPLHLDETGQLTGAQARLDARLVAAARAHGAQPVFAWLQAGPHGLVATRLMERRPARFREPRWWLLWAAQVTGLVVVAMLLCQLWVDNLLSKLL
jgi:hypothetical protein